MKTLFLIGIVIIVGPDISPIIHDQESATFISSENKVEKHKKFKNYIYAKQRDSAQIEKKEDEAAKDILRKTFSGLFHTINPFY